MEGHAACRAHIYNLLFRSECSLDDRSYYQAFALQQFAFVLRAVLRGQLPPPF